MADALPPDEYRRAGKNRGSKSGKVADFRYNRPSQPGVSGQHKAADEKEKRCAQSAAARNGAAPRGEARTCAERDARRPARSPRASPRRSDGDTRRGDAGARRPAKGPVQKPMQGPMQRPIQGPSLPRPSTTGKRASASPAVRAGEAYAALDLGTNNCRLLIARPSGKDFTVIDAFSRVVKLGEGLATTGLLSDQAMDRALGALAICADKLKRRNVRLARSVATEACRRAENGPAFIERVRRETGIALDIITAEEEARLAVLGCHILLEEGDGPAVIFDIGGGSTELVLLEASSTTGRKDGSRRGRIPRILDWQSVPWGVVSLTDTLGECADTPEARLAHYTEMRRLVAESFAPFAARIADAAKSRDIRLLGTSGTVTTLASLHLELPHYDRKAVDGLIVPSAAMRTISADLSTMSIEQRSTLPCIGNDRANLVVAGCAILEVILDLWPAHRLGVADRGIREGILRSLMAAERQSERALKALRELRGHPDRRT